MIRKPDFHHKQVRQRTARIVVAAADGPLAFNNALKRHRLDPRVLARDGHERLIGLPRGGDLRFIRVQDGGFALRKDGSGHAEGHGGKE